MIRAMANSSAGGRHTLRVHAIEPRARANGPGTRFTIWVQGCSLGCPGCFNPTTHPDAQGDDTDIEELVGQIEAAAVHIEGITVSGGEPFEQPQGLLALLQAVRDRTNLSIVVFSGFSRREIERLDLGSELLATIDVLVDGRYVAARRLASGLRGSSNQSIHVLSDRYDRAQVEATPPAEVRIAPDGTVTMSGVDPLVLPDD